MLGIARHARSAQCSHTTDAIATKGPSQSFSLLLGSCLGFLRCYALRSQKTLLQRPSFSAEAPKQLMTLTIADNTHQWQGLHMPISGVKGPCLKLLGCATQRLALVAMMRRPLLLHRHLYPILPVRQLPVSPHSHKSPQSTFVYVSMSRVQKVVRSYIFHHRDQVWGNRSSLKSRFAGSRGWTF